MNLALPKNFLLMKFMNRHYPRPVRGIFAVGAFLGGWLASGRIALGADLAAQCWHDAFKTAVRRGAWYLRRGWMGIDLTPDDWFDPTEGLTGTRLDALERFIIARGPRTDPEQTAADRAFVAARRLDTDATGRAAHAAAFKGACDTLLTFADPASAPAKVDTAPDTEPRTGDFPIQDAHRTLTDFATLFPVDDMPWFVISGTFLGLVRENGFLPHDYDIDLGVFEPDIDIAAATAAIAASETFALKKYDHHSSTLFRPDVESKNADIPYILKLVHVSGVHIDLFIHYRDTAATPPSYWHGSSLHRWNNSPFDLKSYDFYDTSVLGPADADTYLTENYGDWRTPVTDFNCTTGTPNLALVPHPTAVVIFLRRYAQARRADAPDAPRLEAELLHNGFLRMDAREPRFAGDLFAPVAAPHAKEG